ncbi:MAG: beta strand repeat-containing protein [Oscillospiraceae bacterium]
MRIDRKFRNKVTSIIISAALLTNSVPFAAISEYIPHWSEKSAVAVDVVAADYSPSVQIEEFNQKNYSFNDTNTFISYCYYYQTNEEFAVSHAKDDISIAILGGSATLGEDFTGLGTESHPFEGTVRFGSTGSYSISVHRAFFAYLSDKAVIKGSDDNAFTLALTRLSNVGDNDSAPLLADYVVHSEGVTTAANWSIAVNEGCSFSGAIGEIGNNAKVNLSFTNNSVNPVISNTDIGMFCGTLGENSELTANYNGDINQSVTSSNGNAGGLIGIMKENSSLNVTNLSVVSPAVTASGEEKNGKGYAGGLVGKLDSTATVTIPSGITLDGIVTGTSGAGGLYGYYKCIDTARDETVPVIDLNSYNVTAESYSKYCGGLFGVLETTGDLTITNSSGTAKSYKSGSGNTYSKTGYYGGIAGRFATTDLANTMTLSNINISPTSSASFNAFGGVFGIVDSAAYIKADNVTVNAAGTDKRTDKSNECPSYAYFGGLIGATANNNGVFVDLGSFKLTTSNEAFRGGGIAGQFYNGVLRLRGTTDMSGAKPCGLYQTENNNNAITESYYGQLIGNNDNVLVYALGNGSDSNWKFERSNGAVSDDLGTWGEVVRIPNVESDVVTFNESNHTVTVNPAATSMNSSADFAKTALNIQLNQGIDYGCLLFDSSSTRNGLLSSTLSLTGDISLSGTGITGFMRDNSYTITTDDIGGIGTFTGTLDGNNHTVTLAAGESYGIDYVGNSVTSTSDGTGQIYRHRYNGLFSVTGDGTINNLTIDGNITVRNAGMDGMCVGGAAARSHGSNTFNNITAKQTMNYHEGSNAKGSETFGKNIGGLIAFVDNNNNNRTITISGISSVSPVINLTGCHQNWVVYGGIIGKITADRFTVNIGEINDSGNKLTVGANADVSGVTSRGDNNDGGGLIGYITSNGNNYRERTVNLNNIVFDSCTVGNAANKNAGGFLGYAWLNTTANLSGVTVTGDSSIDNSNGSNSNIGVMCFTATGKWKVDLLNIEKMSMTGGGNTSIGMLVNQMYNNTSGLYLDVLNSGYTLSKTGITLPEVSGIYDEIAAYSASDVLNGGGVISVNMNENRQGSEADITKTGTYQNKLTSVTSGKYANKKSRYYYNLDVCNKDNNAQNILLWSVKKYAADNIKGEFITTINNLTGTADMTGLSFYPVPKADDCKIGDLTLTFDYSKSYTAESTKNNDSYIRDPGEENQHYLMHSGLFLNSTAGKTLTINGALFLKGNFLETGNYKGVLISDTMRGNLTCTSGSVSLDGITSKTKGNTDYSDGYMLINNIKRNSDNDAVPKLELCNVSTGNGYTSGAVVAKSLIGNAYGPGLDIEFSKIKLDGRTADANISTLDSVYNTTKSIFSQSTLLYSIKTDQNAQLIYNYTYSDDWGGDTPQRNVTYGYEVSGSKEYSGKENKYSGKPRYFTNPETKPNDSTGVYDFSISKFLKYVYTEYTGTKDTDGYFYRELKVNVEADGLTDGCGTYNDPYIISNDEQLKNVAAFLLNGKPGDLGNVKLPATQVNSISNNAVGNRWCTDKSGTDYHAVFAKSSDTEFKCTENGKTWTSTNVQYWLANAYYKVTDDITLDNSFAGLGGTTANTAFRGVIVGNGTDAGVPKITITNKSDNPFINVSNGCVVKDINIVVAKDGGITKSQTNNAYNYAYFGYAHTNTGSICRFYGGIIGEVMGGDNIIDNSYVTFDDNSKITLSGINGTIVPVGGYVGVVVFGGVIFKNMDSRKTTIESTNLNVVYTGNEYNLANNSNQEAWAAIYVNPIVGRVINGYAVNETGGNALDANGNKVQQFSQSEDGTYHDEDGSERKNVTLHTLKNGKKHYSIADINPVLEKLDVESVPSNALTDGTINIPNSQSFFIMSLITQSTSGTAQTENGDYVSSLSYGTNSSNVYGMSHTASYADVGTSESESADFTDYASSDTAANTAVPYIIERYTKKTEDINSIDITVLTQVYICNKRYNDENTWYLNKENAGTNILKHTAKAEATLFTLARVNSGPNKGMYVFYYLENNVKKYLWFNDRNDYNLRISNSPDYFNLTYTNNVWLISDNIDSSRYLNNSDKKYTGWKDGYRDLGNQLLLINESDVSLNENDINSMEGSNDSIPLDTPIIGGYNARCVTSTTGYYDINLTGSAYVLPDSFRGLGSVGYYDKYSGENNKQIDPGKDTNYTVDGYKNRASNKYSMKTDQFDGNLKSIDVDIYLNKFKNDNYFNMLRYGESQNLQSNTSDFADQNNDNRLMHGIGLFDSIVTKNEGSTIKRFTMSGSVNTEIYNNTYNANNQEVTGTNDKKGEFLWLCTGGVCGWGSNGLWLKFDNISLDNLNVRGSASVGGLIGYSGNKSKTYYIRIQECSGENLKINLSASHTKDNRHGIGAFVGKVKEGGVIIYGTSSGKNNTDLTQYSTVEIGSFKCINGSSTIAGGLVGYAGNGCQVYDMHVKSKSGSTATIGGSSVNMAGGIVGLMQPVERYLEDCVAEFARCEVQNIDVQANLYAGGLYGGTWNTGDDGWVPYKIAIDNCKVIGNSQSPNTIKAKNCAGGFVADGLIYSDATPNIEIKNSVLANYNISNNATDNIVTGQDTIPVGVGGFVGFANAQKSGASVTCYIHDCSIENSTITSQQGSAGGIIGQVAKNNANNIVGYNIKLDQVKSGSPGKMGAWIGILNSSDTTTSIQFTGLGIYGNSFSKNVGNGVNLPNASFVFADYTGQCNDVELNTIPNYSKLNKGTTVDMPKYPFVNIFPQSSLGTGEVLSGDGAVLNSSGIGGDYADKTAEKTMAAKIYSEINTAGNDKQYYKIFNDAAIIGENKIDYYMKRITDDDGDRISTFATERNIELPTGVDDFACLVIANTINEETTNLINRYIQLVTNTPNSGNTANFAADNSYYKLDIKTCTLDPDTGSFEIDETQVPGLICVDNQFMLNPSHADSLNANRFTLLDVQFLEPLSKNKIAYHLYVPVYTIKEMSVNFYASAKTGSHSVSGNDTSDYENLMNGICNHVDSLNTWLTHYIRYEYQADDINTLLNSGKLQWNYKKSIKFETFTNGADDQPLPDTTYMTLVNPNNNSDQVYYAKVGEMETYTIKNNGYTKDCWNVELEKFKDDGGNTFTVPSINEMIAKDITVTDNTGKGKYNTADANSYDVYVVKDGQISYYSYNINNTGDYDLAVDSEYKLHEDYYLSIYVPKPDSYKNEIYYYSVMAPDRLNADSGSLDFSGKEPKVRSAGITVPQDSQYKKSCNILVADLFKQTVEERMTVKPDNEQITVSNRKITVDISALIEPNSPTGVMYLNEDKFFHSFYLTLVRYSANGYESDIKGLSESNIKTRYSIDSPVDGSSTECAKVDLAENYLNIQTATASNSSELVRKLKSSTPKFEIYAKIEMDFDGDLFSDEFPVREAGDEYGVNVMAASNLAYDADTLPYTSMTKSYDPDGHRYYIESIPTATLIYSSRKNDIDQYDEIGLNSKNQSTLGVNGRTAKQVKRTEMPVNTEAFYNVQSLSDSKNATILRLVLALNKKTDAGGAAVTGVSYEAISNIEKYIDGTITFTSGEASATVKANGSSVTVDLDAAKCNVIGSIYDIEITFNAKTGDGFTEYANYKVDLKAELFKDENNNVENSVAEDHMIYTNAKINPDILSDIKTVNINP